LSGRQDKTRGMAQSIDGGMDFGAQPAFAVSDGLVTAVFF
jgi:hypothetical protein